MSWVAAGTAAAVVVGGLIQSDSASSAAKKQEGASRGALDEQAREFNITNDLTQPYRASGNSALLKLNNMLGTGGSMPIDESNFNGKAYLQQNQDVARDPFYGANPYQHYIDHGKGEVSQGLRTLGFDAPTAANAPGAGGPDATGSLLRKFSIDDFWKDPVVQAGYTSGLDLGTKALKNAAPLTTGLDSGAALKELVKFGTDYTGNMAAGSQSRFVNDQGNVYNKLASMAGLGQTAVGQSATAGMNNANNSAAIMTAQGNAAGAARIAQGNAIAGSGNTIANWWQQQAMIDKLNGGRTGGTRPTTYGGYDYGPIGE